MSKNHGILKVFLVLFSLVLLAGFASAANSGARNLAISTEDFSTTDTTPTITYEFNHSLNATADCSLYFNDVVVAQNDSTPNNTWTEMTPTTEQGFAKYEIFVTCTDGMPVPITNQSSTINGNIHLKDCSGSESTLSSILVGIFMIGIVAMLVFFFMNGGGIDVKVIIGGVVILLLMVVLIAILHPLISGLCG